MDEVHIIAKHTIECMCKSLCNTSSTVKDGPPSPAGEGYHEGVEKLVEFMKEFAKNNSKFYE